MKNIIPLAILVVVVGVGVFASVIESAEIERIAARRDLALSSAVRVKGAHLVHTTQLIPDKDTPNDAAKQISSLLKQLDYVLDEFGSDRTNLVKVNVYVRDANARDIFVEQLRPWKVSLLPAVSFVATPLASGNALIAMDVVFVAKNVSADEVVTHVHVKRLGGDARQSHASVLPRGDVVYVSGQAEAGDLAEATRATLAGLLKTLEHLKLERKHIVQVKCFLQPMKDVETVNQQIASFFGQAMIPAVSHVEWVSGSRPIEIELIAWAPAEESTDTVSYITPPWLKSSPVFSRVARIHGDDRIYVSGLYADKPGDGASQVQAVFQNLKQILNASNSDLKHLAKATYYVSNDDASNQLNQLRPSFYDPERPPAASKAVVRDIAAADRSITIDMIASPLARN